MRLFRAISENEFQGLLQNSIFQKSKNTLGGKWFAESLGNAISWGKLMGHIDFWVVEIELPEHMAIKLFSIDFLDGIGPAKYAELKELKEAVIIEFHKVKKA